MSTLLTPENLELIHTAFTEADPRGTGVIDVWTFQRLIQDLPWELEDEEMYEMVAGVEKDSQGNISFPSVLRVVDSHIRVRVDEEDSFHAAWVALGGAKRRRRNFSLAGKGKKGKGSTQGGIGGGGDGGDDEEEEEEEDSYEDSDSGDGYSAPLPGSSVLKSGSRVLGRQGGGGGGKGGSEFGVGSKKISVDALLRACKRFDLALNVSELVQFSTSPDLSFDEFKSFLLTGSTAPSAARPSRTRASSFHRKSLAPTDSRQRS